MAEHSREETDCISSDDERTQQDTEKVPHALEVDNSDVETSIGRQLELVRSLARQYTGRSSVAGTEFQHTVFAAEDQASPLNPYGSHFNARVWAKAVANVIEREGAGFRKAGLCFRNLNVFGWNSPTDYQKDVGSVWLEPQTLLKKLVGSGAGSRRVDILQGFDGLIRAGEMCVVLGPPGSGCSTFLKTVAGETSGMHLDPSAYMNYQGIPSKEMHKHHRGDAIYTAEIDVHFPMLTVGDTLTFASRARCPATLPHGLTRNEYADHFRDVVMAMYGISHTFNTRVGNEYVRGVSGTLSYANPSTSRCPLE